MFVIFLMLLGSSAKWDNLTVLSTGGLFRRFFGAHKLDVFKLVFPEQLGNIVVQRLPHLVWVSTIKRPQSHPQVCRRRLHDLELLDAWDMVDRGAKEERWKGNLPATLGWEGEHVGGSALYANRG